MMIRSPGVSCNIATSDSPGYGKSLEHAVPQRITERNNLEALRPPSPTEQDSAHSVLDVRHNDQGIKGQMRSRFLGISLRNSEVRITADARKLSTQHVKSAEVRAECGIFERNSLENRRFKIVRRQLPRPNHLC